ncbi:precorrin-3B synthase [Chelatococcus sambhunathii]|uniref:precorrin-3B synthase n=1 Tax=Chelatococcus sambhunathii TaxID=363953 RepID=UPI002852D42B|nr:precorrin-3B synthase [Chelatococcus sambhunathii]
MADCPGLLHLAQMADGGLARLRVPGGLLSAAQARAVADAAEALGSGLVDLTNRANLQIRGLSRDAGGDLAEQLSAAAFAFHGEADRRRNILLDPFSGLDPREARDLRPLAQALDEALIGAAWIGRLSPKFCFVLDGGGESGVAATPSDVTLLATGQGIVVSAAGLASLALSEEDALSAALAVAACAADVGPDARATGIPETAMRAALGSERGPAGAAGAAAAPLRPRHGAMFPSGGAVAISIPAPVGRLDAGMLRFLADVAETEGRGRMILAPWSAVVLPRVRPERAARVLAASEAAGFVPVAVADRLSVVACSGAPACERAREPARALGAALLALAAAEPGRLPEGRRRVHLSACPKGCAGSAPADLLLLGASERSGWTVHAGGAPRRPGPALDRLESAGPAAVLAQLAD